MKVLTISDLHVPFHSKNAINKLISEVRGDEEVEILVLNGDIVDFYTISRFLRDPSRKTDIHKEIIEAKKIITRIGDSLPNLDLVVFNEGNHEHRLKKYMWRKAPELSWAEDIISVKSLFALEDDFDKVEHHKYMDLKNAYKYAGVLYIHTLSESVSYEAGYSASLAMRKLGTSLVMGHTHRLGVVSKRFFNGTLQAAESGCLADLYPEYAQFPNWQNGYVITEVSGNKSKIYTHLLI